jgi:hypothetical protein
MDFRCPMIGSAIERKGIIYTGGKFIAEIEVLLGPISR